MNHIRDQDPALVVSGSTAHHFAIIISDQDHNCMYWSGNGFHLFDDDGGAYTDVRLWSGRDAVQAYYNALNIARVNPIYADTCLQIAPFVFQPFETPY